MKKISREAKIGFVALITIGVLIWGWNFLKGISIFKPTDKYYVVYNNVQGLIESGVVMLNGYKVGHVSEISFDKDNFDRIVVAVVLDDNIILPSGTAMLIASSSLISDIKELRIILGDGPGFHESGDTLISATEHGLTDIIGPIKDKAEIVLSRLDSTLASLNDILDISTREHLKSTLADLSVSADGLSKSLASGGSLDQSFTNLATVTGTLSSKNEQLSQTLQNLSSISDSLEKADIKAVVEKADQVFDKLDATLAQIKSGEGTAGKLIANDSVYNNLNNALFSLDSLLIDLKEHPKRYVHFSVFGKKDR
ncbi:MAG: MCE family protein [Bacteroidales bacterium]|nr:MCE family protein [Bacteroidales bacterium]MBN2762913.1 MCE family protein [Bacteroidales bacterium]